MFPPIGLRIIKSAIAVALCYVVSFFRGSSGIVFYSQLAALWCIQMYVHNSWNNARQRTIGTSIGALYGLIFLLVKENFIHGRFQEQICAALISAMIILVLYTTVLLKKKRASYFSCVVFLSIVVNHIADSNPYWFVWNRFLDTMIGIAIGIGVNSFSLPKVKNKDILFVSGLDDTLLNKNDELSDYSKVELNHMLDDGANFTISTMRTPASLLESMKDIRLRLPVITMDGAVLYDVQENIYKKVYVISNKRAKQLIEMIHMHHLKCFVNVIIDDLLVIYYEDMKDENQRKLVQQMRRSPYRNYVKRDLPDGEDVAYIMILYKKQVVEEFYHVLEKEGYTRELKVLKYDSDDYPGYTYIKIYNKNASRERMIEYLQMQLGIEKTMTFGSIKEKYDVWIEPGDSNKVVHVLKKKYEPFFYKCH